MFFLRKIIIILFVNINMIMIVYSLSLYMSNIPRKFLDINSISSIDNDDISKISYDNPLLVRVLQYNVLADGLSGLRNDNGRFSRISNLNDLKWENRKNKLLNEIVRYDPDVITLSEVDHYHDFFLPSLLKAGYEALYAPKPISACLDVSNSSDGCAIFTKVNKLKLISSETLTITLKKMKQKEKIVYDEDDEDDEDVYIKAQNQVALIGVYNFIGESGKRRGELGQFPPPLIVSTTHLKSSKSGTGERYRQREAKIVLNRISNVKEIYTTTMGREPVVIFSCCLNAAPRITSYAPPLTYNAMKSHRLALRSVYTDDAANNFPGVLSNICQGASNITLNAFESKNIFNKTNDYISKNHVYKIGLLEKQVLEKNRNNNNNNNKITLFSTWKARWRPNLTNQTESITKSLIDYISYGNLRSNRIKLELKGTKITSNIELPNEGTSLATISIQFLLRSIVYLIGTLIVTSSFLLSSMSELEKLLITSLVAIGFLLFEILSNFSLPYSSNNNDNNNIYWNTNEDLNTNIQNGKVDIIKKMNNNNNIPITKSPLIRGPSLLAYRVLDLPQPEDIGPNLLPNNDYPSDHVSIGADLKVIW